MNIKTKTILLGVAVGLFTICGTAEQTTSMGETPRIYAEDKVYAVAGETIVFHTHPSPDYDGLSASLAGNRNLNRILHDRAARLRSAGMAEPVRLLMLDTRSNSAPDYYIQPSEVAGVVHSIVGCHNLTFPDVKEFVFTGGILESCLCQSLRDAIKGTEAQKRDFTEQPLKITFVTDAIYLSPWDIRVEAGADIPYEKRLTNDANFANTLKYLSDQRLIENLSTYIFNLKGDMICPAPGSNVLGNDKNPKITNYAVTLVKNGKEIGTIGLGKQKIVAVFMTSQEYEKTLNGAK